MIEVDVDIDLVEVGLELAEGFSDEEFNDFVGGWDGLDPKELFAALLFESKGGPEEEPVLGGGCDFDLNDFGVALVIMPAVEA